MKRSVDEPSFDKLIVIALGLVIRSGSSVNRSDWLSGCSMKKATGVRFIPH